VKRKREKSGLTLVELLTVLAIISLLVGLLIPAVTAVKRSAMEAKQIGQFFAIDVALTTFKDPDAYGDYPPSAGADPVSGARLDYCGAQKLCEALLGWDLLGFHPKSEWTSTGRDASGTVLIYDPADLSARKGPYLELGTQTAFKLGSLFARTGTGLLAPDPYVLCDVFGKTKVTLPGGKVVKAGAPILYYKANPSGRNIQEVYDYRDNEVLVFLKEAEDGPDPDPDPPFEHPLADFRSSYSVFYGYITDPKITAKQWPYRPGSYILISAGADGFYGTPDDIRNFGD
jgi:prepilin-type N-terminal cleavage/methylation domain-containing protein